MMQSEAGEFSASSSGPASPRRAHSGNYEMSMDSSEFHSMSSVFKAETPAASTEEIFAEDPFGNELHGLLVKLLHQRPRYPVAELGTMLQRVTGNTWLLALIDKKYGSLEQFLRKSNVFQLGLDGSRTLVARLANREARHAARRNPEMPMQDEIESLNLQMSNMGGMSGAPAGPGGNGPGGVGGVDSDTDQGVPIGEPQQKLIEIIADLLREHGHLSVANIGTRLHRLVSGFTFNLIKERYGGLKRFLTQLPHIFEIARDHPFDPTIRLVRPGAGQAPSSAGPLSASAGLSRATSSPLAVPFQPPVHHASHSNHATAAVSSSFPPSGLQIHTSRSPLYSSPSRVAEHDPNSKENLVIRKLVGCAIQILRSEGPQSVVALSGRLDPLVGEPQLPALIKKRFGGLKAFFCMQPAFFVRDDQGHSFNATVELREPWLSGGAGTPSPRGVSPQQQQQHTPPLMFDGPAQRRPPPQQQYHNFEPLSSTPARTLSVPSGADTPHSLPDNLLSRSFGGSGDASPGPALSPPTSFRQQQSQQQQQASSQLAGDGSFLQPHAELIAQFSHAPIARAASGSLPGSGTAPASVSRQEPHRGQGEFLGAHAPFLSAQAEPRQASFASDFHDTE